MVAIADNGLFSSHIRDILGMAPVMPTFRDIKTNNLVSEKENVKQKKTDLFQDSMLKMTKDQTLILKKLLEKKENIDYSALSVATGMVAANIASKIPIIKKTMDSLDKINAKGSSIVEKLKQPVFTRTAYPVYARSSSGVPRIPPITAAGRPLNQSMIKTPAIGAMSTGASNDSLLSTIGTLGLGGLGTLGLSSFASGASKALGVVGGVASKVALPLAAAYAGYEGIKGGFNAENVLGRDVTVSDRVRVGINEAIDGVLLGLPSLITENVFGKKYSVAVNELMIGIGDSVSSAVTTGWNAVKDNSLSAFESIYNSFPSSDQISSTFGAVRDKLYDTMAGFSDSIANNTTTFLSNASTWISGKFDKATTAVGNFFKVSGTENLKPIDENSMQYGQQSSAAIVGEKISDYLDEKLKKRDEGFMAWLKNLTGLSGFSPSPSSDPINQNSSVSGTTGFQQGGGNTSSSNGGNTSSGGNSPTIKSVNSSTPAVSMPTPDMAIVGKNASGNDAKIPLPPDAGRVFSNAFGRMDYADPNSKISGNFSSLGSVSAKYESGKDSYAQTGGDGGRAYGKYQFDYTKGGMDKFFNSEHGAPFKNQLLAAGSPGSAGFNAKWKELSGSQDFKDAQDKAAKSLWYDPAAKHAESLGFKTGNRGVAESLFSGSIQHGGVNKIISAAANTPGFKDMSPEDQIKAFYSARKDYVNSLSSLTDKDKARENGRYDREIKDSLALSKENANGELKGGYKEPSYLKGITEAGRSLDANVPVKESDGKTQLMSLDEAAKTRNGQAFGGGETNNGTLAAAKAINALQGDNINRFTAFNDNYHAGSRSKHASGLAGDYTLKDPSRSSESTEQLKSMFKKAGLSDDQYRVIDEYKNPSAKATAGHIHYQFNSPEAAGAFFKSMGDSKVRQALGIKDVDMNKSIDDKLNSKSDIYNNSPFLKSRNNAQGFDDSKPTIEPGKASSFSDKKEGYSRGDEEGNRGGVKAEQPVSSDIKSPETKNDVTAEEASSNMGNGGFTNTPAPNYNTNSSSDANAQAAFNQTPSIDNELAMLSVNSTMLS